MYDKGRRSLRRGLPWVALIAAAALGTTSCGLFGDGDSGGAAQSAAVAGAEWPVFGGVRDNTRFSGLDQINTENVEELGVAWSEQLNALQSLNENYPIMLDRTLYVTTNTAEVVAFDAVTGKRRWKYAPKADFSLSRGVGGYGVAINRGVAVDDQQVYVLTFDDHLQALSRATGEMLWSSQVADPHTGAYQSMAPTVWNRLVFVGVSGAEDGVRGYVAAYDAKTGKQVWRFWTVPKPGEGWVQKGRHGGGSVYMPPTIDTRTGLVYVGTGSPSPTINGEKRPGENLYTSSILALEAKTGELRWYYQQVPHDVLNHDAASPVMIFDTEIDGKKVHAVAEAGKNGYFYVLNAGTGKPLFPRVPFVEQKHRTQPDPTRQGVLVCPGTLGGAQYGPAAYSPQTKAAYVTGFNSCMTVKIKDEGATTGYKDFGGEATPDDQKKTGTVTAVDVRDGKVKWQKVLPFPVLGGATATAGGLVLAGDAHGNLYAFDAEDGSLLWRKDLGLAHGAAPIVYSVGGTDYVAVAIGGSPLSANFGWGAVGSRIVVLKLGGKAIRPYKAPGSS
jgi:alcohol dehydrogenase (cytochrome c)